MGQCCQPTVSEFVTVSFQEFAQDGQFSKLREFYNANEEFQADQLNCKDKNGRTALHHCSMYGYSNMVEFQCNQCKQYKINIDTPDLIGYTPALLCCIKGTSEDKEQQIDGLYIGYDELKENENLLYDSMGKSIKLEILNKSNENLLLEYFEDDKWIAKKLLPQFSRKFEFISTYTSRAWRIVRELHQYFYTKFPTILLRDKLSALQSKRCFQGNC